MGFVTTTIHALPFQHSEECLPLPHCRATANTAHAANQVVPLQEPLILVTGELTVAIAVKDDRFV